MKLSLIIPCKNADDPKLADLLASIDAQDFPKKEMEVLVISEGTSESAKAIGIRNARGDVVGILASDNVLPMKDFLTSILEPFPRIDAAWTSYYLCVKEDDVLNRYFALIGGNDPLCFYMGKNDRKSALEGFSPIASKGGACSVGDNGFFIKRELIAATDLDNYYHVENALDAINGRFIGRMDAAIWHRTGGNIFKFFAKRYRYGLQHAFNKNRRWHLVDFRQPQDIWRLACFIIFSLSLIQPLTVSIRGYLKIRDLAWFMHPVACLLTVFTYGMLIAHLGLRRLYQSLFAPMAGRIV